MYDFNQLFLSQYKKAGTYLRVGRTDNEQNDWWPGEIGKHTSEEADPLHTYPCRYEEDPVGLVLVQNPDQEHLEDLLSHLAPLLVNIQTPRDLDKRLHMYAWLTSLQQKHPDLFHWVGIYFRASALLGEQSTDLVLGPFLGAPTEHVRIPLDKGLCGLAIREERIVNMEDVHSDPRHIACDLKTRSEIVIPLRDGEGRIIAELDIDSQKPASFSPSIQSMLEAECQTFAQLWG